MKKSKKIAIAIIAAASIGAGYFLLQKKRGEYVYDYEDEEDYTRWRAFKDMIRAGWDIRTALYRILEDIKTIVKGTAALTATSADDED